MTVVYADSVFCLNALMDYLLLLSTARLAGIPLRRRRYALAALLGGAYAVACFLPGASFLAFTPVKAAAGVLLALVAFGGEERLLRLTVLLFAVSCAMAGCVLGLGLLSGASVPAANGIFYTDVSFPERGRQAPSGGDFHRRAEGVSHRPLRQRQQSAGPCQRGGGTGGLPRRGGRCIAEGGAAGADAGGSGRPCGSTGAAAAGGAGAGTAAAALPNGWNGGGTAAGGADGLHHRGRGSPSRGAYGPVPHQHGNGGPLGRSGEKGRKRACFF